MKTILFLLPARNHASLAKFAGFCRAAKRHDWRVQTVDAVRGDFADLRRVLAFWNPDGAIVDCGGLPKTPRPSDFGATPVVYLGILPTKNIRLFNVYEDPREEARLAARELLNPNRACYAYVGYSEQRAWSEERNRHFRDVIEMHGRPYFAFTHWAKGGFDSLQWGRRFNEWILSLPKPCGLLAANDLIATRVISACVSLRLKVPEDVAVLGINNDETVCLHSQPHLSSILPDFESSGALAARLLAARLHSPRMEPTQRTYAPLMVVRRASTYGSMPNEKDVSAALELIREKACAGLRARDVAAQMRGSRRLAEMNFRKATGRSILAEIQAVRMECARELLVGSDRPVKAVANMCGYASENSFRRIYRSFFGVPPRS